MEGSVERKFSKAFSAGLQGYHFQQISGDSGPGATLGSFKGRVSAVGVTAAYNFEAGRTPVSLRGHVLKEFGEKNRLAKGTTFLLNLDFPLHMVLPSAAP